MNVMQRTTQQHLLVVNRAFYASVANEFDRSRAGLPVGWQTLSRYISLRAADNPVSVLDAGCGNGRFAWALDAWGTPFCYTGVDADATLLAHAAQNTATLVHGKGSFVQADLAEPAWLTTLMTELAVDEARNRFDLVVCFATLHHFPGYDLRLQIVKALASLVAQDGVLILSTWQFLTSARFVQKQIKWQTIGLTAADVEPGDALLPWQQGGYAVRYVHQIDKAEMMRLAQDAGLTVVETFYADGKEGNLNLYTVLVTAPT